MFSTFSNITVIRRLNSALTICTLPLVEWETDIWFFVIEPHLLCCWKLEVYFTACNFINCSTYIRGTLLFRELCSMVTAHSHSAGVMKGIRKNHEMSSLPQPLHGHLSVTSITSCYLTDCLQHSLQDSLTHWVIYLALVDWCAVWSLVVNHSFPAADFVNFLELIIS